MASIGCDSNGRKRILYFDCDGKRKTIRLGKADKHTAESVCGNIEKLLVARENNTSPPMEVARWVSGLPARLHGCLVKAGLVLPRLSDSMSRSMALGDFIDLFIAGRPTAKERTVFVWRHTRKNLIDYFGADKAIAEITPGDADDWREHLKTILSASTAGRRAGVAKQFFRWGMRKGLIPTNPFQDISTRCPANRDREFFVTREMADKLLAACPDAQWRLIVALCRFAGLRCPSEVLSLRWCDIDWAENKMMVRSPKTEHHEGKGTRLVPIFPEVLPCLQQCYDEAAEGEEFVITRYRDDSANLRTQLCRIIRKAGLVPWSKLFVNFRSTCETELCERFPEHVVCAWIGHSQRIARRHYLQVTDDHFRQAATGSGKAAQNPAQSGAESDGTGRNSQTEVSGRSSKSPENSEVCSDMQFCAEHIELNPYARQDSNL